MVEVLMPEKDRMREIILISNTAEFRAKREIAVKLVDAVLEPYDDVIPDKFYHYASTEMVALLLYFGMLAPPGSSFPPQEDPRLEKARLALLALADTLKS
jgi:hypothetical protein